MKAKRLLLCILLSVALTVTFIPVMSYAVDDEGLTVEQSDESDGAAEASVKAVGDMHLVKFDTAGSYYFDTDYDEYFLNVDGGKIITWSGYAYDVTNGGYSVPEGDWFNFDVNCDAGQDVNSVQYSIDGGEKKVADKVDTLCYEFEMPEGQGDYEVTVYVDIIQGNPIKSANLSIKAPVCGTVVKGNNWNTYDNYVRQKPQPVVTVPNKVNYELYADSDLNYGLWINNNGDGFQGKIVGGKKYSALISLRAKGLYVFDEDSSVRVSGGKLIDKYPNNNKYLDAEVEVTAVHNYAQKTVPAGLHKDGAQYDQCSGCGAIKNKKVIPGYANYYVKKLKVKKGKKSFTVKWKKQSKKNLKKFNGYQIRYSTAANMSGAKMANAGKKAKSKKIKKLQKKTTYYVQVRTYTKVGAKVYYSKWSPTKKVKTK